MYINGDTIQRVTYTDDSGGGVDPNVTPEPTAVPTVVPTPQVLTPGVTYELQAEDADISTAGNKG